MKRLLGDIVSGSRILICWDLVIKTGGSGKSWMVWL